MNADNLYDLTCRLVFEADSQILTTLSDLSKLLPSLRLTLVCTACGNILIDPYSPTHEICQHHVCRTCLGAKKNNLKPSCSWCKDSDLYSENSHLKILLKCYRKLCGYLKISPIYEKLIDGVKQGGSCELLNIINEVHNEHFLSVNNSIENNRTVSANNHLLISNHSNVSENVPLTSSENNDVEIKVEPENSNNYNRNNIDDEVFSEPSTNGEIQTICESDIAPTYKNSDDEDMLDIAPVLSPIPEHVDDHNMSGNEDAPMLSPISHTKPVPQNDFNIIDNIAGQKIYGGEASVSSNNETNSDSSSLSSLVSSPMEILQNHDESPTDPMQDPLQEYNISSESVLGFQSADLMGAADVNVLASLDEGSYTDLADINLSSCPLTSIGEENSKDNIIPSMADTVLSIQSSNNVSHMTPSQSSLFCQPMVSPKIELPDEAESAITTLAASIEAEAAKSISSTKIENNVQNSVNSILNVNNAPLHISVPNMFSPENSLGSFIKCSVNSLPPVISSPNNIITHNNIFPTSIQNTFCKVQPVSNYIRPQMNTQLTVSQSIMDPSKTTTYSSTSNSISNINQNLGSQIIQAPICTPIMSDDIIQQPFTSHHVIHQKPCSSTQIVQKSFQSPPLQPLPGTTNLIVNSSISQGDLTRMVLTQQQPQQLIQQQAVVSSQNIIQTSLPHHKLTDNNISMNSVVNPTSTITQTNPNLPTNFLNLIPGTLFQSTNNIAKVNTKETQMKATPILNNGSPIYSVMFSEEESTKITIKRSPTHINKPYILNQTIKSPPPPGSILPSDNQVRNINIQQQQQNNFINQNPNIMKKPPKAKAKPKPKRKGCRCGNATPSPGKLTCCGQRCPCYVEAKACIDCRCKGCRNPHRPGGRKVRPVIPHQANIQIHQIHPVQGRSLTANVVSKPSTQTGVGAPVTVNLQQFQQQHNLKSNPNSINQTITATSAPQTYRTFPALHAVKAVPSSMSSLQGLMNHNNHQFINDMDNKNNTAQESSVPVASSNLISMKPIKVRLETNNVVKKEFNGDNEVDSIA